METLKENQLNPEHFRNATLKAKIGCVYPNLYTQAHHVNERIEKTKNNIVKVVKQLHDQAGFENAKFIIDSIYHYIEMEFSAAKDCEDYFNDDTMREISNGAFSRVELAKGLIDLSELADLLADALKEAELTKKNVLL